MLDSLINFLISAGGIVFCFGLVVFIHEFGHFFVAKKSGVQVDQFAFGFGKEIVGFDWNGTRYSINWLPLGGYVKMAGEQPDEYEGPVLEGEGEKKDPNRDRTGEFMALPWYRRIPIVLAGPFMNYVLAFFVFWGMFLIWGEPVASEKAIVGDVVANSPAAAAGLKPGDEIIQVNGAPVESFNGLADVISKEGGKETILAVKRDEAVLDFTVVPKVDPSDNLARIGVARHIEEVPISIVPAATKALQQCWFITAGTLTHLWEKIGARERPDVAGPLGIGQAIAKAAQRGFKDFWMLVGLISVALGLINLFPIPLVDGGHIVYFVIEGIRGKPLSVKTMGRAQFVGLVLLLGLLVFATTNDVRRIWPGGGDASANTQKDAQ